MTRRAAKPTKYRAVRTGAYASKKESARAIALGLLQRAGKIKNLREQVRYELLPNQYGPTILGKRGELLERAVHYVADFCYLVVFDDGRLDQIVVEDCKGMRTREYIIKRKLMLHVHGIRITET